MKDLLRLFLLVLSAHIPGGYLYAEPGTILFIANAPEQDSVFDHRYFQQLKKEGYEPVLIKHFMRQGYVISDLKRAWPEARGLVFLGINPDYSKRCLLTIDDADQTPSAPWLSHIPTASAEETLEYLELSLSYRIENSKADAFNTYPVFYSPLLAAQLFKSHYAKRKLPLLATGYLPEPGSSGSSEAAMTVGQWFQQQLSEQLDGLRESALQRIKKESILYMPVMKNKFLHTTTLAFWILIGASHYSRFMKGLPAFSPVDTLDKIVYPIYYAKVITSSMLSGLMIMDYLDELYFWLYPNYWMNPDHGYEAACAPVLLGDGTLSRSILPLP
ncbi:MAG: hypothetical protein ACR2PT_14910 [Endozoicomonas sp.]